MDNKGKCCKSIRPRIAGAGKYLMNYPFISILSLSAFLNAGPLIPSSLAASAILPLVFAIASR